MPAGRIIRAIVDNDATYKHPNVKAWLTRHPHWAVPLHANIWLLAECGRDVLLCPHAPAHNAQRRPFIWTASAAFIPAPSLQDRL